jgi:hypothetical protein
MIDLAAARETFEASADFTVGIEEEFALLDVPPETTVHTSSPAVDLLYALYFYLA